MQRSSQGPSIWLWEKRWHYTEEQGPHRKRSQKWHEGANRVGQVIKLPTTELWWPGFESQDPSSGGKEMTSKYCPLTSTSFTWPHHARAYKNTVGSCLFVFFNVKRIFKIMLNSSGPSTHMVASSMYVQHTLTRLDTQESVKDKLDSRNTTTLTEEVVWW